jgi:hypothetical protein
MTRDQDAGRSHSMKIDNRSFEGVEEFRYLGTTLTIKILFRKRLRADRMLAIMQCRIFCLQVCYAKIYRLRYTEVYFCFFFL